MSNSARKIVSVDDCWRNNILIDEADLNILYDIANYGRRGKRPKTITTMPGWTSSRIKMDNDSRRVSSLCLLGYAIKCPARLPNQLFSLDALEHLTISNIDIESLPDAITKLQSLKCLSLQGCPRMVQCPEIIGSLTNLKRLELLRNPNLTELHTLGNLTELCELELIYNQALHGLPDDIEKMTKLTSLNMEGTPIQNLPDSFGNLQNLKSLKADFWHLETLPTSFGNLVSLETLDIGKKATNVQLCNHTAALPFLKRVKCSMMNFSFFPQTLLRSWCTLTHLEVTSFLGNGVVTAKEFEICLEQLRFLKHLIELKIMVPLEACLPVVLPKGWLTSFELLERLDVNVYGKCRESIGMYTDDLKALKHLNSIHFVDCFFLSSDGDNVKKDQVQYLLQRTKARRRLFDKPEIPLALWSKILHSAPKAFQIKGGFCEKMGEHDAMYVLLREHGEHDIFRGRKTDSTYGKAD